MKFDNIKYIIKQYGIFYLLGLLLILGMKYFYSNAGSDELIWILAPTTRWVSILSGISFEYESGIGYVNHALRYVIAPSCSGIQFMIIVMAMLLFSFIHRVGAVQCQESPLFTSKTLRKACIGRCLGWIGISVLCAYLLTVLVNGLRIIVAMYLPQLLSRYHLSHSLLTPERLHTIIGTAVYFTALLTIYSVADYLTLQKSKERKAPIREGILESVRKCIFPMFWYFFIVLGLPLLNGAGLKRRAQFTEYSLLITLVCITILLFNFVIRIHSYHTNNKRDC